MTDVGSTKTSIHETVAALGMESASSADTRDGWLGKDRLRSSTDHLLEKCVLYHYPDAAHPGFLHRPYGGGGKGDRCAALVLDYRHDFIVAAISHLPHLIASSLVNPGTRLRQRIR